MKILVIEDDVTLNRLLARHLEHRGYEILSALDGVDGLMLANREQPNLVLLDVMMPVMDGWEVLERLRAKSDVPVILLTAKVMPYDVVHGLKLGADDYVRKPFNLEELNLRIEAVLRRAGQREHGPSNPCYQDDTLLVDAERHVVLRRGQNVHMSPTEFHLLCYLVQNQSRVLAHEQILTHVWGPEYAADTSVLSVYIRYLRQKIEDNPAKPRYIHTEWGVGYRFDPSADVQPYSRDPGRGHGF